MSDDRQDRVSRRAYEIWESEGGEHGRHDDHWHRAASEIDAANDASATDTDRPGSKDTAPDGPIVDGPAPDGTTLTEATDADTASAARTPPPAARKPAARSRKPKAK